MKSFPAWLVVEGEGTYFKQNVNTIWANQGSNNFQKRVNNTNLEHVKAKKSSLIKKSTEAQHVHMDDGNFVYLLITVVRLLFKCWTESVSFCLGITNRKKKIIL